ncbi:hypothetical protein RvY_00176 [Ramazzottius varieornatus]|uniref:Transposase Tc5 C-terminal domain-containing protein n=1 Tax=Ramazzottius varieornatus TaxID=947166 RepID=A0A1D1UMC2_RAMVA|nr:hypothetical protein RvY_00176 [Ramazzottius varieornatus]
MTKKLYLDWSEKVLFPHMEERCIFLADSWKTFTDQDLPVQVHHRDVILRLHSLLYQQFRSPRFENLIAEAWHKSGYTDEGFMYVNPAKFMFDKLKGSCLHENYRDIVLLVCGWCKARLCFYHFYDAHHFCTIYLP